MNFYTVRRDPYLERLPLTIDHTYGVQTYDLDNLYPQRADSVCSRSYTAKRGVERTADFIYGKGWQDPALAKLIVNSERQTINKVLSIISKDKALHTGFALHIKYNLNFRIAEITPIEFMYCRLGLPDDRGNVSEIKYHTNWERNQNKTLNMDFEPETYPVYNPDPNIVREQMIAHGGWQNYPGQILYWTPKPGIYPKCSFDAVFDNAQTQAEIGVFELASIQNGFTASTIFKYPGQFEDDHKRQQFKDKMANHVGAGGAKSVMVVENPSGEPLDLVETIQMQNTDKMFEFTSKNVKNAIRESMAVPAPILAQMPETGMFNKEEIKEAYLYFNDGTSKHRNEISEVIQELMQYWSQPLSFSSFAIEPLEYGAFNTSASVNGKGEENKKKLIEVVGIGGAQAMLGVMTQFAEGKLTESQAKNTLQILFGISDEEASRMVQKDNVDPNAALPMTEETAINDNLKNLTGKQMQNIQRIVKKFNKGEFTFEQAKEMLKSGFGFNDSQVDLWLITPDEE
jgi:hypothetical protein